MSYCAMAIKASPYFVIVHFFIFIVPRLFEEKYGTWYSGFRGSVLPSPSDNRYIVFATPPTGFSHFS